MNIPVIVDVAIGLIFIYLILSLLASEILELIATVLQWRAKHLRQAIINLLAGDTITDQNIEAAKRLTKDLYNHPLLNDLNQEARGLFSTLFRKITWVFSWIYQWLTGREGAFGNKVTAPSYIPGETFATTLIERLGVAKLVEALINAKFNRFRNSIIEDIGSILGFSKDDIIKPQDLEKYSEKTPSDDYKLSQSDDYKVFQVDLYKIYKQFSNGQLTLIVAIDKLSVRIERFISQPKYDQQKKELLRWKQNLFGKQNELAIVNGGFKPTLEEVADLVNLSSRTYQVFKKEFNTYHKQRRTQAADELQNFILVLDSSIRIISDSSKNDFLSKDKILTSSEYREIWVAGSTSPEIGISLSKVGTIIESHLSHLNKQGNLKAFKEGFGEQGRELLGSKISRWKEKIPRQEEILQPPFIYFSLILLSIVLLFTLVFTKFFITGFGGILFVIGLIGLIISVILFNRKPNPNDWGDRESFSNLLDVFFLSTSNLENKPEESPIEKFRDEFKIRIEAEPLKTNKSHLQWELSRLGQSFRQYYRALVVNNADVDLPYVPSSVKRSVASLVMRTKTKIDRTGNEVNQLREEVEIWFDRSMDRSSGVYKRNARGVAILIGFLLAVVTNSNSIYILNRLASDQELRQTVVQGAGRFIEESKSSPSAPPTQSDEDKQRELRDLNQRELRDLNQRVSQVLEEQLALPIGWNARVLGRQLGCELSENARDEYWQKLFDKCINPTRDENRTIKDPFDDIYNSEKANRDYTKAQKLYKDERIDPKKMNKPKDYFFPTAVLAMIWTLGKWKLGLLFLLGWVVTAIAISMGATFWFDLLGKLVNVRNTGNRPPSSANQTSVNSEKSS